MIPRRGRGRGRGGDYSSRGGDRHRRSSLKQGSGVWRGAATAAGLLLQLLDAEAAAILVLPRRTGGRAVLLRRALQEDGEGMAVETRK